MAYSLLATPGKVVRGIEIGACIEDCEHTDCTQTKAMAKTICYLCGETIGYETEFQTDDEDRLVHFWCAIDASENA